MIFATIILFIVVILLTVSYRHNGFNKAFKDQAFGIILAPIAALAIAFVFGFLTGCSTVDRIEVFAGIEQTKKLSPQCDEGGASDRITSNLGVSICKDFGENTFACALYRHHSCAISNDREQYDAVGIEARKVFHL